MSDEELELDLPETRTDFLRSLTMGVEDAKRQRLAAEKEMVAPGGRLGSGDAFTQILTSVLPVVMGAAIAGRRGGMVGAEAGQVANQGLFEAREKSEKEKQAAAKVKYQEASDAERAALAKLSSGTEGMFRDDRFLQGLSHSSAQTDKKLDAMMQRTAYGFDRKDASREDSQSHAKEMLGLKYENDVDLQDSRLSSTEKVAKENLIARRDNLLTEIEARAESAGRRMSWEERMTEGKYAQEDKILGIKLTADERKQLRDLDAEKENLKMSLSSRALTSAQDRESREKIAANSLEGQNQRTDKVITAAKDRLVYGEEGRKERQQIGFENEQSKFKKPGLATMIDPDTGAPYKKTAQEHAKTTEIRDGYLSAQTYIDGMYDSLDNENLQGQIKNFYGLINSVKRIEGYGAAFSAFEALLAQAGLPQVFDADYGGVARWFKGKARGGQMQEIMDVFNSDLNRSTQSRLANNKEIFVPPPARGKRAMYKGDVVMYTGTVGPDLKPVIVSVKPKVTQ